MGMAAITIRNVDDALKKRLRMQAAAHGRSMEEEARDILRSALSREAAKSQHLGSALHELFKPYGGVDLDIPEREPMREPPRFD
jgi:plasmid stability protein